MGVLTRPHNRTTITPPAGPQSRPPNTGRFTQSAVHSHDATSPQSRELNTFSSPRADKDGIAGRGTRRLGDETWKIWRRAGL
jgi:hypothetical protein